jgi:hypothetical protein
VEQYCSEEESKSNIIGERNAWCDSVGACVFFYLKMEMQ